MKKEYTFKTENLINSNVKNVKKGTNFLSFKFNTPKSNPIKDLDALIASNIISNNPFLAGDTTKKVITVKKTITPSYIVKDNTPYLDIDDILNFILNKKVNKTFELSDGTPVTIYDDEIQIGSLVFSLDETEDILYMLKKHNMPKIKKTITITIKH